MHNKSLQQIFLIISAVTLFSCAGPKFELDTTRITPVALLNSIDTEQSKVVSLEATSRITVDSPEFSGTFFAEILYLEPDSLLISATGPFGVHAGKLFIGRERFIFHNQIENRFYNGSVAEYTQRNFFQFPLNLSELMNVFAGKEQLSAFKISDFIIKDDAFYIEGQKAEATQQIWIDNDIGKISKMQIVNGDDIIMIKEYGDFIKSNGICFPRKISVLRPQNNQAVAIYHTRVSLNNKIDSARFKVRISDKAQQIDYLKYNGN